MPREVSVAAIQMDAAPVPLEERLGRAEGLVEQAATDGAQLVVLPELFNLGYGYDEGNFERAESLAGPTIWWMRAIAARLGIHLAGSLLLRDGEEIYNALCLFAPDGRMWRYNKRYPWAWERHYFRGGCETVVADTDLGRIGMLVCWDAGHADLWRDYAGKVEAMIVSSCPPDGGNPTYRIADGPSFTPEQLNPLFKRTKETGRQVFGTMMNEQTAWLGVPTVATVGTGYVTTAIPGSRELLLPLVLGAPRLWSALVRLGSVEMSCPLVAGTKVIAGSGQVLAELGQEAGEDYTIARVVLPDGPPQPSGPQPPAPVEELAYLFADWVIPALMAPRYRQGVRRLLGRPRKERRWGRAALVGAAVVAAVIGLRAARRRLGV